MIRSLFFAALASLALVSSAQAATQRLSFEGTGIRIGTSNNTFTNAQLSFSMLVDDVTGAVSRISLSVLDVRTSGLLNYTATDATASGNYTRNPLATTELTGWDIGVSDAPSYGPDLSGTTFQGRDLENLSLSQILIGRAGGTNGVTTFSDLVNALKTETSSTGPAQVNLFYSGPNGFGGTVTAQGGRFAIDLNSVSLSAAPIPLPAGGVLLFTGFAALIALRKRTQA